jgi:peptidoglycan-associated lipoprotein
MFECERRRKMQKKIWLVIALLLVIPGLLLTVGCQKKTVTQAKAPAPAPAAAAEPAAKKPAAAPVKAADTSGMIMQEDIFYDFDKSTLTPAAQDNLMQKAAWLRDNPDVTVTIEGHCDERGTNEYNLALGDRRADSAKAFLVDLGIASSRLTTISYGEERPLCMQQNEECWAKNRRGHFVIN